MGGGDLVEQSLAAATDDHLIAALVENLGGVTPGSDLYYVPSFSKRMVWRSKLTRCSSGFDAP